jgi:hypothetical protein
MCGDAHKARRIFWSLAVTTSGCGVWSVVRAAYGMCHTPCTATTTNTIAISSYQP